MKRIHLILLLMLYCSILAGQETIVTLYEGPVPGSEEWDWEEQEMKNEAFNLWLVYNVTNPTLTVFKPEHPNGTAIVICPGGGFQFLSIDSEGYRVARSLNKKGITAFVLKYRVARSFTDNPMQEFMAKQPNTEKFNTEIIPVVGLGIMDAKTAIAHVREHAEEYGVLPDRIGIIGFSAGGTLATGAAYLYEETSRPDFAGPIYPYVGSFDKPEVPADAPPMFILAATDDIFGFQEHCIGLYNDWDNAGKPVELHLYARGGHGFGMNRSGLPVDTWIDRFTDWLGMLGYSE